MNREDHKHADAEAYKHAITKNRKKKQTVRQTLSTQAHKHMKIQNVLTKKHIAHPLMSPQGHRSALGALAFHRDRQGGVRSTLLSWDLGGI